MPTNTLSHTNTNILPKRTIIKKRRRCVDGDEFQSDDVSAADVSSSKNACVCKNEPHIEDAVPTDTYSDQKSTNSISMPSGKFFSPQVSLEMPVKVSDNTKTPDDLSHSSLSEEDEDNDSSSEDDDEGMYSCDDLTVTPTSSVGSCSSGECCSTGSVQVVLQRGARVSGAPLHGNVHSLHENSPIKVLDLSDDDDDDEIQLVGVIPSSSKKRTLADLYAGEQGTSSTTTPPHCPPTKRQCKSYQWSQPAGPQQQHVRFLRGDFCRLITHRLAQLCDLNNQRSFPLGNGIISFFFGFARSPYCEMMSENEYVVVVPRSFQFGKVRVKVVIHGAEMSDLLDFNYEVLPQVGSSEMTPADFAATQTTSQASNHISRLPTAQLRNYFLSLIGTTPQTLFIASQRIKGIMTEDDFDHYENMLQQEKRPNLRVRDPRYISHRASPYVTDRERTILADWIGDVCRTDKCCSRDTMHLAVNFLDRVLERTLVTAFEANATSKACLLIASKFNDVDAFNPSDLVPATQVGGVQEMIRSEASVLATLEFDLNAITTTQFVSFFSKYTKDNNVHSLLHFLSDLTLLGKEFLLFDPSVVARACTLLVSSFSIKTEHLLHALIAKDEAMLEQVVQCALQICECLFELRVKESAVNSTQNISVFKALPKNYESELMHVIFRLESQKYIVS